MARFLRVATRRSYPPENKHVSHVEEEERERKGERTVGMEGPKKRITLTISVALQGSPPPSPSLLAVSLLAFPTQMLSLCIRPNSISFRWRLPLRSDFADGARGEKVSGGILIQDRKFTAS